MQIEIFYFLWCCRYALSSLLARCETIGECASEALWYDRLVLVELTPHLLHQLVSQSKLMLQSPDCLLFALEQSLQLLQTPHDWVEDVYRCNIFMTQLARGLLLYSICQSAHSWWNYIYSSYTLRSHKTPQAAKIYKSWSLRAKLDAFQKFAFVLKVLSTYLTIGLIYELCWFVFFETDSLCGEIKHAVIKFGGTFENYREA